MTINLKKIIAKHAEINNTIKQLENEKHEDMKKIFFYIISQLEEASKMFNSKEIFFTCDSLNSRNKPFMLLFWTEQGFNDVFDKLDNSDCLFNEQQWKKIESIKNTLDFFNPYYQSGDANQLEELFVNGHNLRFINGEVKNFFNYSAVLSNEYNALKQKKILDESLPKKQNKNAKIKV